MTPEQLTEVFEVREAAAAGASNSRDGQEANRRHIRGGSNPSANEASIPPNDDTATTTAGASQDSSPPAAATDGPSPENSGQQDDDAQEQQSNPEQEPEEPSTAQYTHPLPTTTTLPRRPRGTDPCR